MKSAVKYVSPVAAGAMVAWLSELGSQEYASFFLLAVVIVGFMCWITSSADRSDRMIRMILAVRGEAKCLEPRGTPDARRTD